MTLNVPHIRSIMEQKDITQAEIARAWNVSRQAISIQLSRGTCSIRRARHYAQFLGVPVSEIVIEPVIGNPQNNTSNDVLERIAAALERIAEK